MRLIIYTIFILFSVLESYAFVNVNDDPNIVINEMIFEIEQINKTYFDHIILKEEELLAINNNLALASTTEAKLSYLLKKDKLKEDLHKLKLDNASNISRIRYLKGLQIVRILYEKVLSLDHHFASVRTFSEINNIANPNQYPEFNRVKELVHRKQNKKQGFDLTSVLGTNTIVSVVNTFSNMLVSDLSKEEKEAGLKDIECIIDFTLRMQGDLNTIYFETAYLQKNNENIKDNIEILFRDYTQPIGYLVSLEQCRSSDDWENVRIKTNNYVQELNDSSDAVKTKMYIDIEFPIDRLMQFITQYNNFIDQCGQFYEKFKIVLNSYENEKQCQTKLPLEYQKLKDDIDVAIDKFNIAYKTVEINGSKMKEILYGINEYE